VLEIGHDACMKTNEIFILVVITHEFDGLGWVDKNGPMSMSASAPHRFTFLYAQGIVIS